MYWGSTVYDGKKPTKLIRRKFNYIRSAKYDPCSTWRGVCRNAKVFVHILLQGCVLYPVPWKVF